jgi:DNA-binding NarL/FixJ family response regulator
MPLTILVTDDDLGTRLSVSDYLELQGYAVVSAEDGHEALTMVEKFHPNLIVTDISMPQMDGYELIRQVRSQPSLRLLPVVFLTALNKTEERVIGYQLGCDAYLPKPFELSELGAVVRNLLDRVQTINAELQFSRPKVSLLSHKPSELPPPEFSVRELDVLRHISEGLSNVQIGDRLHLSPRTVEKHVSSLLRKIDANNRAELVRYAIEHHLVQ